MNIHEIASNLCAKAERMGLDNPTENMISDTLLDVQCNTLNAAVETALSIPGQEDCQPVLMYRLLKELSGDLAERLALDMDHNCKDHKKWYRKVKAARNLLATIKPEL